MTAKIGTALKQMALIVVVLAGFLGQENGSIRAGASSKALPNQHIGIVAQNETRTSTGETNTGSSENGEPETKKGEEKKSARSAKPPHKDFRPSEKIEAEQAVDFPYDI